VSCGHKSTWVAVVIDGMLQSSLRASLSEAVSGSVFTDPLLVHPLVSAVTRTEPFISSPTLNVSLTLTLCLIRTLTQTRTLTRTRTLSRSQSRLLTLTEPELGIPPQAQHTALSLESQHVGF
jgi:hypothetical protein